MPGSAFLLATFSALYLPMKGKCAFPSVSEQASELASKERMVEMDSWALDDGRTDSWIDQGTSILRKKKEIPEKKGTYCIFVISGLVNFRILEQMTYIRRIVIGVLSPPFRALRIPR